MIRRWLYGVLLGLLLAMGVGYPSREIASAQADPAATIFQLVNQVRAGRGLPPFQYNAVLAQAAQNHANWMAANVAYSHVGAGGSTPQTRAAAAGYVGFVSENIVGGTNMSPRQGIIWWENSPVHYNTIVSQRYLEAGTGYAANGSQSMYVLLVGRPDGAAVRVTNEDESAEPLIITPIELAEPREDGSIVHVVQQGQALWTIAAYYDVDLDYLRLINGLEEGAFLHLNDEIMVRLPDGQDPPPTPTPPLTHIVQSGESAWSIAIQHGISLDDLFWFNDLTESSVLQPGTELVVRLAEGQLPPPTPTPPTHHLVQSGQSAWTIAALYKLSVDELLALNGLTADSILRPGDELLIRPPTATPTEGAVTSTPTPRPSQPASPVRAEVPSPVPEPGTSVSLAAALPGFVPPAPTTAARLQTDEPEGTPGTVILVLGLSLLAGTAIVAARRRG